MNFLERQQQLRAATRTLVILFIAAVLTMTSVVSAGVVGLLVWLGASSDRIIGAAIISSALTLGVIVCVSAFKTAMLQDGGGVAVAESLGAVRVSDRPAEPTLLRYRNIVEEIAIAATMPVPALYVLPDEVGINAFAAGYSTDDAAVCVTQGSLERLNRDELQGVIAHEFSHIVNGDMSLSIRLIGVLAGLTGVWNLGRVLQMGRDSDTFIGFVAWVIGLVLSMLGWIGVFFGRLIKAAVSRRREFLADVSAVQFTRQTAGLAGALKKIGGLEAGSKVRDRRAENVSHMLFSEHRRFSALYATHPPILERIRELEPSFSDADLGELRTIWKRKAPHGLAEDVACGVAVPVPDSTR